MKWYESNYVPMPLEWHPAYAGITYLAEWLDSTDQAIRFPVIMGSYVEETDGYVQPPLPRTRTLTKQKCVGLAPYVGRPFLYEWHAACDELGRWIAGEARIRYVEPDIFGSIG